MATNSYQGVNGVQGINSFGGGNSFAGTNTYGSPDNRLISASDITDTKTREALSDQFKPRNSYTSLGVAPIGALNARLREMSPSSWQAPSTWGKREYDAQEESKVWHDQQRVFRSSHPDLFGVTTDNAEELNKPVNWSELGISDKSLSDYYKEKNDEGRKFRSAGFVIENPTNEYLTKQGWSFIPGYRDVGSGNGRNDAQPEEGAGAWTKANPEAYKGMGMDWITYSPTLGYGTGQYLKQAPQQHGIGGFLSSPAGMMLMTFLGAGLGAGLGGAGGLLGEAGAGGIGAIDAASTFGSSAAGLSPGALGAMGSGASLGLSAIPTTGGLFGNGGIYGSGLDLGSFGNKMGESFLKTLATSGGDVKKAGMSSLTGGLGQGVNSLLGNALGDQLGGLGTKLVGSTSMGALNALLRGGSAGSGALSGLLGGGMSSIGVPSTLASIPNKLLTQRRKKQNV